MIVFVLLVAVGCSIVMTPIIRHVALHTNFVAMPRQDRVHASPTPLLGGVALYLGLTAAFLVLQILVDVLSDDIDNTWPLADLIIIYFIGTALGTVGLLDDRYNFPPVPKAILQLGLIILIPFFTTAQIKMPVPGELNLFFTVLWFMFVMNSFNLLDNMDGVATIVAAMAGLFFVVVGTINGQFILASLAAAISGTAFGFLRYNLFQTDRRIFMGDAGSLFLGYWLAVIGVNLSFEAESPLVTWPVPVLILGVPIFDTALVFISRIRRGKNILQGGTDHLSHRLMRLGFGHYGVPFGLGLVNTVLGCLAILIMHSSFITSILAQLTIAVVALYLLYEIEFSASYKFITGQTPPESMGEN